ncbi:MAG: hypothetical protein WBB74_05805 [Gaiellaceae bacterium]
MERERGPLENELYKLLRSKGLAVPELLEADLAGRPDLSTEVWVRVCLQVLMQHMEAILLLARKLDERAPEDRSD